MVAVNPFRDIVDGPPFVDRPFSLWTAVEDRSGLVDAPHWRNGVNFNSLCGIGGNTYDDYCTDASAATKAANVTVPRRGATPMTPFAELDCSPVGYDPQEQRSLAAAALTNTEMYQVEQMFWTGTAGGDANQVYPHLAASTAVDETSSTLYSVRLQCAATQVTGSVVLDVTEGLGRLEAALVACSGGMGVIHVPYVLGEQLFRANAVKVNGAKLMTQTGHQVVLGAGYPGTAPDGSAPPVGAVWVYATSPLFGYRSSVEQASFRESFDRSENTHKTIAERTYVVAFDCCCLFAVLISTGGIVTGTPLSAV